MSASAFFMSGAVIYYIRHGETDWNVEGRLQGSRDIALNAVGRLQAVAGAKILSDLLARDRRKPAGCDYVSSPFLRARETMELTRTALGLDRGAYRVDARLHEIAFGKWEGLTFAEIEARDATALAARALDKWGFVPPGGESYAQVEKRMADWFSTLKGDTVAIAHGGTARALLAHLRFVSRETAAAIAIEHGVVYRLAQDGMSRHD
jgi:broad specificity phosphatase PhoE